MDSSNGHSYDSINKFSFVFRLGVVVVMNFMRFLKKWLHRDSRKWLVAHVEVLEEKIIEQHHEIDALNYILGKTPKSLHPTDVYMAKHGLYRVLTEEDRRR